MGTSRLRPLPYRITRPPSRLRRARLDNIALVPASLLFSKETTYLPVARKLPTGSVLCIPGTQRQQRILTQVTRFFKSHGRQVITMPLERITTPLDPKHQTQAEQVRLAF